MKIPYVNIYCQHKIPQEAKEAMTKALITNVDDSSTIIGSNNLEEIVNGLKEQHSGYTPTLIERMIENKVIEDYQTIQKAIDLIKFYKTNGCTYEFMQLPLVKKD